MSPSAIMATMFLMSGFTLVLASAPAGYRAVIGMALMVAAIIDLHYLHLPGVSS